MATVGIWKISSNLKQTINYIDNKEKVTNYSNDLISTMNYIENESKTEKKLYVSGINCNVDSAFDEMIQIKKLFHKENGILGFHAYQSFKENEVTPEEAHKIGCELANKIWGDRFQVVVATHLNTKHYHNHFVINSVSYIDGKRYYDNRNSYAEIRKQNDLICRKYGLSYLPEKTTKKGINYFNYQKNNIGNNDNYYTKTKKDLDECISNSNSYNEFINKLKTMGYEIINRNDKLSIRHKDYRRNIRIERCYGSNYTICNIKKRIANEPNTFRHDYYKNNKKTDIVFDLFKFNHRDILYKYIMYLKKLNKYNNTNFKTPSYVNKKYVNELENINIKTRLIVDLEITKYTNLTSKIDIVKKELEVKKSLRNNLYKKQIEVPKDLNNQIKKLKTQYSLLNEIKNEIENHKEEIEESEVVKNERIK